MSILPLIAAALLATATNNSGKTTTATAPVTPVAKKVPGTPTVTNIMAGQSMVAGTVTVVDDQDLGTLTVTYQLNNGWYLKETHLYAGTIPGIPVGNSGNPRPGQFPYKKTTFAAGSQTHTVVIPLAGLPTDVITLAAHCVVTGTSNQTGWGQGPQINDGGSWAMRFDHVLEVR